MILNENIPNIKSINLIKLLYTELLNFGLMIEEINLQIYNSSRNEIKFSKISDVKLFLNDIDKFKIDNPNTNGYNLYLIKGLYIKNINLEKYNSFYDVNMIDINEPLIKCIYNHSEYKTVFIEIERYKKMIKSFLLDYRVEYRSTFLIIEEEQNTIDSQSYINYVDNNYVTTNYVTPQQN